MSARTPGLAVEFAVSNMDLYPIDRPGVASWGSNLEQLHTYLEQTGCANFEIVPTTAILDDIAARTQSGKTALIGAVIGSVHYSFNGGRDAFGRVASWRGVRLQQDSVADGYDCRCRGTANSRSVLPPAYSRRYTGVK